MSQLKIYLPPPTNWQDFQRLVKDIAAVRYDPDTVVEYGGQGQSQNGVDVYAEDRSGKKVGIQCKETKKKLTGKMIDIEVNEALKFIPALDLFIVATTDKTDANLQKHVIDLNSSKAYHFKIRLDFWNDITDDINRYAMVLNTCYLSYRQAFAQTDESNHLSCLRVAFDRPAFKDDFTYERNYGDFESALVDTMRLFRTGFTMDRWQQTPVVQTIPVDFLPNGPYRRFVSKIESKLGAIYKNYIVDKAELVVNQQFGQNRAGHYNITRGKLLIELNKELAKANLAPIDFTYA